MKIRQGTAADLDRLVEYGELFWKRTYFWQEREMEYDGASVRQLCTNLMDGDDTGHLLVVAGEEDEVLGFALVAYYPFLFNFDIKMSGELAFYLDERLRGNKIAVPLLKKMEEVARADGCRFLSMISMEHSMDVGPLYVRLGYSKTETTYTKEL